MLLKVPILFMMSPREITAAAEAKFHDGVRHSTEFFMGQANVQRALSSLVDRLEQLELPYAIAGAMALNEYGYVRVTVDVDVVLTRESLETFKRHWLGRGYLGKVIHVLELPEDFAGRLDESVRQKYRELWQAARDRPDTDLDER